jgi:hypothetical protein
MGKGKIAAVGTPAEIFASARFEWLLDSRQVESVPVVVSPSEVEKVPVVTATVRLQLTCIIVLAPKIRI